jgi:hypothetical protein
MPFETLPGTGQSVDAARTVLLEMLKPSDEVLAIVRGGEDVGDCAKTVGNGADGYRWRSAAWVCDRRLYDEIDQYFAARPDADVVFLSRGSMVAQRKAVAWLPKNCYAAEVDQAFMLARKANR